MLGARWYKVLYDLWGNKTRTSLIVLSIAMGLFALGVTVSARAILSEDMAQGYRTINLSNGTIQTLEYFDQAFVEEIRLLDGIADADARAHIMVRFQAQEGVEALARWRDLQVFAVADYEAMRVNKIRPQSGAWPPPARELLVERAALDLMGAQVGDWLLIETTDQQLRKLRIAGTVHDMAQMPAMFNNVPYAYVSFDTLEWLGEPRGLNELHIVVQDSSDSKQIEQVVNQAKDVLETNGYTIPTSFMAKPGEFPLGDILEAVLLFLALLGALSLLLSAFMIFNSISALMAQQVRQIGVIKAVGAQTGQIVGMYLALVLAFGILALLLAVPLAQLGAFALAQLMAGLFNFDVNGFRLLPWTVILQMGVGLLTPAAAALYPLVSGLRVTAAEAMSDYGLSKDQFGRGGLDRLLTGRSAVFLRFVSRPMLLSLRNTFRRQGRLALTLVTLSLAGAMFISVFSIQSCLSRTLDDVMQAFQTDFWFAFAEPQAIQEIEQAAMETPGVLQAKVWTRMPARRVREDGSQGELLLLATPVESGLMRPTIVEGRWLRPGEKHGLVISTGALADEPDLTVGDEVTLKLEGRETRFSVVGIALGLGVAPWVYADFEAVAQATGSVGLASSLMVVTERHDKSSQLEIAGALEKSLRQAGMRVSSVQLVSEESAGVEIGFNIVVILALVMAALLAVVGGLGLMGALGINVLERTREIGVMRAIGARDGAVARIFIAEGLLIGLISWGLGVLMAMPLSRLFSDLLGKAFLRAPLSYAFSLNGAVLWLGVALVLSALASFLPARGASRLTVRQVLA